MPPCISIITPIYKAQDYLHRCVESLLAQTFTDFELILVDDGSPDGSGLICDTYAQRDNRVKVIHKANGGVSSARQCGIENATGTYTIHADPDDWVDPTMLQELYAEATTENADIVMCDYYAHRKGRTRYISQKPQSLGAAELLKQMLRQELHGSLCNKLIKRELYTKYNITFPTEITRWEDLFVVCSMLTNNIRCTYISKAFYHYDQSSNSNSIARGRSHKGLHSQMLFIEYFCRILPPEEFKEELYRIKAATKELAFNSGAMQAQEVKELYREINGEYIARATGEDLRRLCFSRFLSGEYSYSKAKRTRRLLNLLRRIKKLF